MSSTVPLVVLDSGLRAVISFQTLEELWFGVLKGDWDREGEINSDNTLSNMKSPRRRPSW